MSGPNDGGRESGYVRPWQRVLASGALDTPSARCGDPPPDGLLEGIRLFNAREFFECHEALEEIWHAEREPIRYLYQGILQVGVGFHHLRNHNLRGATLLLRDGIEKTSRFLPACMTVDTARLVREAQSCLDAIQALGDERIAEFDWTRVPAVHLTPRDGGSPSRDPHRGPVGYT